MGITLADYGFGEELAAARRRNGYSIQQVSDAIRIRPDILRAIEMADFARMPAKGFARNQVSAYARFLGLDSAELTRRFLSAYAEFERSASTLDYITDYQQPTNDRAYATARRAQRMRDEAEARPGYGRSHNRRAYGESSQQRRRRDPLGGESTARRRANDATRETGKARYAAPRRSGHRPGAGDRDIGSRGFRPGGTPLWRNRKLWLAIAVLVILVVIIFNVTHCGGSSNEPSSAPAATGAAQTQQGADAQNAQGAQDTQNAVQVTGGSSSNAQVMPDTSSNALTTMPDVKVQATSFNLTVTIPDGDSSWLQIDVDGTTPVFDSVYGPQTYTYTVTQSAYLEVGSVNAVSVTVDGSPVELNVTEDGLGMVTLTLQNGQVVKS